MAWLRNGPMGFSESSFAPLQSMHALYLAPEAEVVRRLLPAARLEADAASRAGARARRLIEMLRQEGSERGGWNGLVQEFRLSSGEGLVLLGLAEALLRIPDPQTVSALLAEKIAAGDWTRQLRGDATFLAAAAAWALTLGGRIYADPKPASDAPWERSIEALARRLGEPVLRQAITRAMGLMADHFILGRSIDEALERAKPPWRYSFDMLGEAALTRHDAQRYLDAYGDALRALARRALPGAAPQEQAGVSVKLSALHPRFEPSQAARLRRELLTTMIELARLARDAGVGLCFDAEESERLALTLELFAAVLHDERLVGYEGIGLAVQAYQKRATAVVDGLAELARTRRGAIPVRLVKGAYWDAEIKRAQQLGLRDYPVFTRKAHTDAAYLACARALLAASPRIYPMFATHNAHTAAAVIELAAGRRGWEFQRLHGMGEALHARLLADTGMPCRVYAPVGRHRELLPYLVRRLLENGANNAFLNRLGDPHTDAYRLAEEPAARIAAEGMSPHPDIPRPAALCRGGGAPWRCSQGVSPADGEQMDAITARAAAAQEGGWRSGPLVAGSDCHGTPRRVVDPADPARCIGTVSDAGAAVVDQALARLAAALPEWEATSAVRRAELLERAADAIEGERDGFVALLAREAGRTRMNAISEVREAADFCRYYAALARQHFGSPLELPAPAGESNRLEWHGRGVFACISPWNFPLAIFVGQVAAALAAGNCVAAKPAEQTPLTAFAATKLLLAAGIPAETLALLPGDGETVGTALVRDPRVRGIAFTGSAATAQRIHQALAQRREIVPFVAETGGLNCMVADSSALPEQVAADALVSAFDSAGQRCSALRILLLQDEIAPRVIDLLCGAMDELVVGDPLDPATDVGPVIDAAARDALQTHLDYEERDAHLIHRSALPAACDGGLFFAPALVEIPRLDLVREEVFGPILHVLRYRAADLDALLDKLQSAGYGLTLGIQTRIEATVKRVRNRLHAGNCYVNRNMIGAQVGMQPFGGEGLSGTGFKAGGPHYLLRFAVERVVSVNTAAVGGNATLLAGMRG